MFNFKVLQLSGVEDFSVYNGAKSSQNALTQQNRFVELYTFDFPLLVVGGLPKLYLSNDCKKLLMIEQQTTAVIYHLDLDSEKQLDERVSMLREEYRNPSLQWKADPGFSATWEAKTVIHQFPKVMQGQCSANFLFSEDFERMIDFDYSDHKFVIQRIGNNVD